MTNSKSFNSYLVEAFLPMKPDFSAFVQSARALKPAASGWRVLAVAAFASSLAGCAQNHSHVASSGIDAKYGVAASPRVVADGEAVPKGGGQFMVGRPYKIAGKTYVPSEKRVSQVGMASWYGAAFHGRKTANGEIFDKDSISAAHPTMPLPSYARVTNLRNSHSIVVRVNDRGPYHGGRVMDVSRRVAEALDFKRLGTAKVRVEYLARAPLKGSSDRLLLASLRTDGSAATIDGAPAGGSTTMIADRTPARPRMAYAATHRAASQHVAAAGTEAEDQAEAPLQTLASAPLPPSRPFDLDTVARGRIATR
ncbi:MAG: septal ring lytic transglycosylase RlpA family protein [Rhodoblastus sp.]